MEEKKRFNINVSIPWEKLQTKVDYKVTINKNKIQQFLNTLHEKQLTYIDEAVDKSDLRDAIELIDYIKAKK